MPQDAATSLLHSVWGNREFPVDPVWIARQMGLDVVETPLQLNVSGALMKKPDVDPVIVLNSTDSKVRRRFTCAHELGHYVQHVGKAESDEYEYLDLRSEVSSRGKNKEEIYANKFAANLLMPEYEVRRLHRDGCWPVMMAQIFGVSDDAIRYRLLNLKLV